MPTTVDVTPKDRLYILTDTVETNAIQYWACEYGFLEITRDADFNITKVEFDADNEKGKKQHYVLTPEAIQEGVNNIFKNGFSVNANIKKSILLEDVDSEGCDVIVQAYCFQQIVYG